LLVFVALTAALALNQTPHLIEKTARLTDEEMGLVLAGYNNEAISLCNTNSKANWALQTDLTNPEKQLAQVMLKVFLFFSLKLTNF